MGVFEWIVVGLLIIALFFLYTIIDLLTESKFIQKEQLERLGRIVDAGDLSNTRIELENLEKDYQEGTIEEGDYQRMKQILESIIGNKKGPYRVRGN